MQTDNLGIEHKTYEDYLNECGANGDYTYSKAREGKFGNVEITLQDRFKINNCDN